MFQHRLVGDSETRTPSRRRWGMSALHALAACLALQVGGCRTSRPDGPIHVAPPPPPPPAPVARFKSTTLPELRAAVRRVFGEGPFRPGQTLDDMPDVKSIDITEDLPANLVLAFSQAGLENPKSPVIAHVAKSGALRFIQLGPEGDEKISLVAGRSQGKDVVPNDKVFRIEGRWVQRLVEWDTCTRAVAGDTSPPSRCHFDGCPILMTGQRFVHPSGEIEPLIFEISFGEPEDVIENHSTKHVRTSKHCDATTGPDGQCKLDCARTSN